MRKGKTNQVGFSTVETVLVVTVVAVIIAAGGFVAYRYHHENVSTKSSAATNSTKNTSQPANTTSAQSASQVTYSSSSEKASFQYPSNWTVAKPYMSSSDSNNADQVGITSPSGAIKISFVTDLVGFGNEHTASYPLNTVIDKTPITSAPGLYVVSGITTLDGTTYYPWIAVQDTNGILTSGVQGNLATFTARHALNPSTNSVTRLLFATCGARTTDNSPALTQSQATAWFSGTEAQQAKQILLSFSDPQ